MTEASRPGGSAAGFPLPGRHLPTIQGDGVQLRAIVRGDVEAIYRLFSDPDVTRHMSLARLHTLTDAERFLASIQEHFRNHSLYQWGISEPGAPLTGTVTFAGLDADNRRAEIGFALLPEARGRGLMTRAVSAALDFGFAQMNLHRVEANVDPDNEPSIRLLQRLGFRREGLLRERWLVAGEARDAVLFGLLAPEWAERAAAARTR